MLRSSLKTLALYQLFLTVLMTIKPRIMHCLVRFYAVYLSVTLCSAQSDENVNWTFTPQEEAILTSQVPPQNSTVNPIDYGPRFNSQTDCPHGFLENPSENSLTISHTPSSPYRVRVASFIVSFSNYGFSRGQEPTWIPESEGRKFLMMSNGEFNKQVSPSNIRVDLLTVLMSIETV